jgi:3-methylcrotonyl-CoA carboxylase alpha subunit
VTVTPLGDDRYEVTTDTGRVVALGVRAGSGTWVFLHGRVYLVDSRGPAAGVRAKPHDEAALAAPMPATVVAINVAPGQEVKTGDVLIVLEAMKMELAVTAPHDARVQHIGCKVGELVQPGVPLVKLDG